ncbi:hypothetical protein H8D36_06940 [archaeon]|nr:hypothetical protein [archaeon]
MKNIISISSQIKKLSKKDKALFYRVYNITEDVGSMKVPAEMKKWVISKFGSVKVVEKQKIIRIDNNITFESALFNEIRSLRPIDSNNYTNTKKLIKEKEGGPFCKPLKLTPADNFGRIKGKKCITASNIAKYDSSHGLVIFKEHDPFKFQSSDVKDYFETAEKWIKKANKQDPERIYPFIMWNCLWKASASIIHGHMQTLLANNRHYGEIEKLKVFADSYETFFGSDYFKDLYLLHKKLDLGFENKGNKIMAYLTPKKEKEIFIIAKDFKSMPNVVYKVLKSYLKMGVQSFNLGVYLQPLDNHWQLPVIIRIIDRGKLSVNTTDIGGMELFAGTNVIESDPYKIINFVKKEF